MLKINITLPNDFLREIDKTAKEEHLSRSEFIRKAVRTYWEVCKQNIREAMEIQDKLRKKAGKWNGVAEIRKWRETR